MSMNIYKIINELQKTGNWNKSYSREEFEVALGAYHKELRDAVLALKEAAASAPEGLEDPYGDEERGLSGDRDAEGADLLGDDFGFTGTTEDEDLAEEFERGRHSDKDWGEEGLQEFEDTSPAVERSFDLDKDIVEYFADPSKLLDPTLTAPAERKSYVPYGKRLAAVDAALSKAYQYIYGSFVSSSISASPKYRPWTQSLEYVIGEVGIGSFYNATENEIAESLIEPIETEEGEEVRIPIQAGSAPIDWRGFTSFESPTRSMGVASFFTPPGEEWTSSVQVLYALHTSHKFYRPPNQIPLAEEIKSAGEAGVFGAYEPFKPLTDDAVLVSAPEPDARLEARLLIPELDATLSAVLRETKRLKSMLDFAINESNSTVLDKRKVLNRVEAIRQHVADSFDDLAIAMIRRDEQVGQKILEMKKADIYGADSLITSGSYRVTRSFLPNTSLSEGESELFDNFSKLAIAIVFPDITIPELAKYKIRSLDNAQAIRENWAIYSEPYSKQLRGFAAKKLKQFFGPGKKSNNSICSFLAAGVQRRIVMEAVSNKVQQKQTLSDYTDNCGICGKNIVVDRGERRMGSEGRKAKHEYLYSEYNTDIYGLVRKNGTIITLSDLMNKPFPAPNVPGIDTRPMRWDEIQELVSSNNEGRHRDGVIRQNHALKSMGALPTHKLGSSPREISGSRFKCPYSAKTSKESCGMSLDISPILNTDGPWQGSPAGLQARGVNMKGESRAGTLVDSLDKAVDDGKISDDQRAAILKEAKSRASGGWRYSNKVFNCPTKISNVKDTSSDDLKALGYRFLAAPISGPITEDSYRGFRDGSSSVYPASDGNGGHYMSPEQTLTYLVCGAGVSISAFDKAALAQMLSEMSEPERAQMVRAMGELGVSSADLLPLLSKLSEVSSVNFSEEDFYDEEERKLNDGKESIFTEGEAKSLGKLISYAMASTVELDKKLLGGSDLILKDVISNIQLVCRHGHKFSINDSLMFGITHTAINLFAERKGWYLRGDKWDKFGELVDSEGSQNFKLTLSRVKNRDGKTMVRELSELEVASGKFLRYDDWQQRMQENRMGADKHKIGRAIFEAPNGKVYSWGRLLSSNYAWGSEQRAVWSTARMLKKRDVSTSIVQVHHESGGTSMDNPADITGGAAAEAAQVDLGRSDSDLFGQEFYEGRGEAGVRHVTVPVGAAVSSILEVINDFLALSTSLEPEIQGHNVGYSKPDFNKGLISGGGPVSDFEVEVGIDGIIGEVTLAMIGTVGAASSPDSATGTLNEFSGKVLDAVGHWLERGIDGRGIYNLDARIVGTLSKSLHTEIIRAIAGIIMNEAKAYFSDDPDVYDRYIKALYVGGGPASPVSFALDVAGIRMLETATGTVESSLEEMTDLMNLKFSDSRTKKLEKDVAAGKPGALKVHAAVYYARILKAASALYLADALARIYNVYMSRKIASSYIGYDIGVDLSSGEAIISSLSSDPSFIERITVGVGEEEAKLISSNKKMRPIMGGEAQTSYFNPWYEAYYENIMACLATLQKQTGWVQTAGYSQRYQQRAADYIKGAFAVMAESEDSDVSNSAKQQIKYYVGEVPTTEVNLGENSSYIRGMRESREIKTVKGKEKSVINEDSSAYEMAVILPATTTTFKKKNVVLSSPIYVLSHGGIIYNESLNQDLVDSVSTIVRRGASTGQAILLCRTNSLREYGTIMSEADGIRLPDNYARAGWQVFSADKKYVNKPAADAASIMEHPDTMIITEEGREVGYENRLLDTGSGAFYVGQCSPRTTTQRVFASSLYSTKNSVVGVPLPMDYGGAPVKNSGESIVIVDSKIPVRLTGSNEGEIAYPDISDLLQRRPKARAGELLLEIKRVYDSYSSSKNNDSYNMSEDETNEYKKVIRSLFGEYRTLDLLVEKAKCGTSRTKGKSEATRDLSETVAAGEGGIGRSFDWKYESRESYYIPMVEPYIIKMMLEEECFSPEWGGHSLWRPDSSEDRKNLIRTCLADFVVQANRFDIAAKELNKRLGRSVVEASHFLNPKVSLVDTGLLSLTEARTNLGLRAEDYDGDFPVDQYHNAPLELSKKFPNWLGSPGSYYRIGSDDSGDGKSTVGGKDSVLLVSNQLYTDKEGSARLASIQNPDSLDRISPSDIHSSSAEVRFGDPAAAQTKEIDQMFGEFPPEAPVPKEKTGKVLGKRAMMNAIGKYLQYSMKKKADILTDPSLTERKSSVISVGLVKYSEKLRTNIYRKSIVVNARLAALWTKLTGQE
jgi:hypothetical protein